MRTIIIADTVMGLDNILAIAGASRGDWGLVIFGFVLSIPTLTSFWPYLWPKDNAPLRQCAMSMLTFAVKS